MEYPFISKSNKLGRAIKTGNRENDIPGQSQYRVEEFFAEPEAVYEFDIDETVASAMAMFDRPEALSVFYLMGRPFFMCLVSREEDRFKIALLGIKALIEKGVSSYEISIAEINEVNA